MKLIPLSPTEEQIELIEQLAACNYVPSEIAVYFNVNKKEFLEVYRNPDSVLHQAYLRGRLKTKFAVVDKQRELAETGNLTAAQLYLKETKEIDIENLRNKVLFQGDEELYR